MSEGVFLLPRLTDDQSGVGVAVLKRKSITTAFGTAGTNISAKQGRLYKIRLANKAAATKYYVQLFDKATAPINTDVPIWEGRVAADSEWADDFGLAGLYVVNGIGLAISSTSGVLTLAGSSDATAYALYTQLT